MKKISILMIGLFVFGMVLSCASSENSLADSTTMAQGKPDGSWVLVELPKELVAIPAGITLTISQIDGSLTASGYSGVNQYRGGVVYNQEERQLSFGMMISTRKAGPLMGFEDIYLSTIGTVDSYRVTEDYLFLYASGDLVAVFTAI